MNKIQIATTIINILAILISCVAIGINVRTFMRIRKLKDGGNKCE
jgi:hypothetical protein